TRPMPRPAPVTSATEPASRPVCGPSEDVAAVVVTSSEEMDMGFPSIGGRQAATDQILKGCGRMVMSSDCSIVALYLAWARRLLRRPLLDVTDRQVPVWGMSLARAARSSLRLVTPSLMYARCRWLLTVRTDRERSLAISLLDAPAAASPTISRSRSVSAT